MVSVAALVAKQIEHGEKQTLLFQFPSDWQPDQGRAVTNHDPDWPRKLEGSPRAPTPIGRRNSRRAASS